MASETPSGGASLFGRAWGFVLVLVVALQGAASFRYDFIDFDDPHTIVEHELVNSLGERPLLDYFRPLQFRGVKEYMPLKTLSFAVDRALFGPAPSAFRLQQQLWYLLCVLGVWLWSRAFLQAVSRAGRATLSDSQLAAISAATSLLFAVHPAHVESATWLSGRKELMCGALSFAVLCLSLRPGSLARVGACACGALALLSKPIALMLLPCVLVQERVVQSPGLWRSSLRRQAPLYLTLASVSAFVLFMYAQAVPDAAQKLTFELAHRPFAGPTWLRIPQQLGLFARLAVLPIGLSPELPTSLLGTSLHQPRVWVWGLLGAALAFFAVAGTYQRKPWGALLMLFILPLFPILANPPWAQYLAGRYLFLSTAPLALGLSWTVAMLAERAPRVRAALHAGLVAVVVIWGIERRAYDASFHDSVALWTQASAQFPDEPWHARRAAVALRKAGREVEAAHYFQRCLKLAPQDSSCAAELGAILVHDAPDQAELLLRAALPGDESGTAHRDLAFLWASQGRAAEGVKLYRGWLESHPAEAEQVKPMIGLALATHDRALTRLSLQQFVQGLARELPTQPPPVELVERTARGLDEPELAQHARAAAAACARTDCFAQRMYGH